MNVGLHGLVTHVQRLVCFVPSFDPADVFSLEKKILHVKLVGLVRNLHTELDR